MMAPRSHSFEIRGSWLQTGRLYMSATWKNDGLRVTADVKGDSGSNFKYLHILSWQGREKNMSFSSRIPTSSEVTIEDKGSYAAL